MSAENSIAEWTTALHDPEVSKPAAIHFLKNVVAHFMPVKYYGDIIAIRDNGDVYNVMMSGSPGSHIPADIVAVSYVAARFKQDLPKLQCSFTYSANDEEIDVPPGLTLKDAGKLWADLMDKRQREYEASPKYAEDQAKATLQKAETQAKIDAMLGELDSVLHHPKKLAAWLAPFALENDSIYANYDRNAFAHKLESAGYVSGEFVGADFNAMSEEERTVNGFRWAVGQGIAMIQDHGMPLHPALSTKFEVAAERLPEDYTITKE